MAHYHFDDSTTYGRKLRKMLNIMEEGDDDFADVRDMMIRMRPGDGSQDAHYSVIKMRFGFVSDAEARGAFEEIDSAYSKTSGNSSVDNVRAARDQLFGTLRG